MWDIAAATTTTESSQLRHERKEPNCATVATLSVNFVYHHGDIKFLLLIRLKKGKILFFLNGYNLMGSYVDQSLTRNESVISRAQTSWIPTIIPVIIGILLLPFYGLGLLIIIPVLLRVWSTELALTNQRVIAKVGFIRRNTVELRIDKVESLGIHQGILGRIFNYGSIVIKGTGGTNTPIPNIKAPMQFRSIVNNHIEEMNSKQQ